MHPLPANTLQTALQNISVSFALPLRCDCGFFDRLRVLSSHLPPPSHFIREARAVCVSNAPVGRQGPAKLGLAATVIEAPLVLASIRFHRGRAAPPHPGYRAHSAFLNSNLPPPPESIPTPLPWCHIKEPRLVAKSSRTPPARPNRNHPGRCWCPSTATEHSPVRDRPPSQSAQPRFADCGANQPCARSAVSPAPVRLNPATQRLHRARSVEPPEHQCFRRKGQGKTHCPSTDECPLPVGHARLRTRALPDL
jgi:hypothetical protein